MNRYEYRAKIESIGDNNLYVLRDKNGKILSYLEMEKGKYTIQDIERAILMPYVVYKHRISLLNPDDTVKTKIPDEDIVEDSISYSESLKNGTRKNLSFKLINKDGKYTPIVNSQKNRYAKLIDDDNTSLQKVSIMNPHYLKQPFWGSVRMMYEIGIKMDEENFIWFKKGFFVVSSMSGTEDPSKEVNISLQDKFSLMEGNTGKLIVPMDIPVGSDCYCLVKDLLNEDFGNGYSIDLKPPIFDEKLMGIKTSVTIRKEVGDTISSVIDAIATQLGAIYYYNDWGNLVFTLLNEELEDIYKPVSWIFYDRNNDLIDLSIQYNYDSAINMIKVIGDNMGDKVNYALVVNNDSRSPICVGFIGKRMGDTISDANVWSDNMAFDIGRYRLRKSSLDCISVALDCKLNPLISLDTLVEINSDFFNLLRQKFVVKSISFSSGEYTMNIDTANVQTLSFLKAGDNGYVY